MRLQFLNMDVILVGDIHGKFRELNFKIHKQYVITQSLIIQLGDFGVGFHADAYYMTEFNKLNKELAKYGNTLLAFRGNHDDPQWFDGRIDMSNLKLIPDYTVIETDKGNVLCIGGEASVDYKYRLKHQEITWWADELVVFDEEKLHNLPKIDYVCTHGMPEGTYPIIKYIGEDTEVTKYAGLSRRELSMIWQYLTNNEHPIKKWYAGHYHESHKENILGIEFNILDVNEFRELK